MAVLAHRHVHAAAPVGVGGDGGGRSRVDEGLPLPDVISRLAVEGERSDGSCRGRAGRNGEPHDHRGEEQSPQPCVMSWPHASLLSWRRRRRAGHPLAGADRNDRYGLGIGWTRVGI
jgi:hypothetical protein